MIFTYTIASVLVTWAIAQGRSMKPVTVTYEALEQQLQGTQTEIDGIVGDGGGGGGDRSANLKYVTAIRNSSIWAEVTVRSLTVSTVDPETVKMMDAAPESLSDKDLAAVKCACQNVLKCVAVDHLLVLGSTEESLKQPHQNERATSVRRAITKITRVLTQYTNEYHEESAYQYVEVTESDDPSKVSRSVSVILKDNAELCGLVHEGADDAHAETEVARNVSGDTDVRHPKFKTTGTQTSGDDAPKAPTFVNNGLLNYGTINNYNINNGNINSATINSQSPVNVIDTPVDVAQRNLHRTPQTNSSDPINPPDAKDGGKSTGINSPIGQPDSMNVGAPTAQPADTTKDGGKSTDVRAPISQLASTENGSVMADVDVPVPTGQSNSVNVSAPTTQSADATEHGGKSTGVRAPISQLASTEHGSLTADVDVPVPMGKSDSVDVGTQTTHPNATEDDRKSTGVGAPIGQPDAKKDGDKSADVSAPSTLPSVTVEGGVSKGVDAPTADISITVDRSGGKGKSPTAEKNEAPTDDSPNTEKNYSDSNNAALVDAYTRTINCDSGNDNTVNSGNHSVNLTNGGGDTGKHSDAAGKENNNGAHGSKRGDNLSATGIASVGSTNQNTVKDGTVEDGVLNNNKMKLYNVNKGVHNKAVINRSHAKDGIINVGTLNNGPTNYGTTNQGTNHGTVAEMNSNDVQQFALDIDKMYSAILARLGA